MGAPPPPPPPGVDCLVRVECPASPSEDPARIRAALGNVFPEMGFELRRGGGAMLGSSGGLRCLERLREDVAGRRARRPLRRQIRLNTSGGSFWFYLNKQAAFAGAAALCGSGDESPLGPITVSVSSPRIGDVTDWLAGPAPGA